MEDIKLYHKLEEFLDKADTMLTSGFSSREWLNGEYTRVYIRRTRHCISGTIFETLDIANICVKEKFRGKGIFSSLLKWLESRKYTLYVESVLNTRLGTFLLHNNFSVLDSDAATYFKHPEMD